MHFSFFFVQDSAIVPKRNRKLGGFLEREWNSSVSVGFCDFTGPDLVLVAPFFHFLVVSEVESVCLI